MTKTTLKLLKSDTCTSIKTKTKNQKTVRNNCVLNNPGKEEIKENSKQSATETLPDVFTDLNK